jgi:uncharacterized protein
MHIQLETGAARSNRIRTYAPGRIVVNDTVYQGSIIVLPDRVLPEWPPQTFDALAPMHIAILAALELEVVLLGTGSRLRFPAPEILAPLITTGIGVEVMDTGAACRTYNILMAEDRKVAAALLMIESGSG